MPNKLNKLYLFFSSFFILSIASKPYALSFLVKIIPIILLLKVVQKERSTKPDAYFFLGLLFSMGGDLFLDIDREQLFIFGLGSFLIAHLFFLLSFGKWQPRRRNPLVYLLIVSTVGIYILLFPQLGELLIPVTVYISVLVMMGIGTVLSIKSNRFLVIGGLSFVVSDSVIGLNKFVFPFEYAPQIIMFFYYLAQYYLTKGYLQKES